MNQNKILQLLETQLDGNTMKQISKCPIIRYPEFNNMSHIDDAFVNNDAVIIFFEVNDVNSGHWCCLMKRQQNEIEFFDPYGLKQDDEFQYLTLHKREELNEQFNPLSKLLNESGYKIIHNPYKLQKMQFKYMGQMIMPETCGRHTSLRLLNGEKDLHTFILDTYIKNHKLGNDDIISCYLINK